MGSTTKTFISSPIFGAIAAVLGWIGALLLKQAMGEADFATLRFGWTGLMVGATAAAVLVMFMLAGDMVEKLVMVAATAAVTFGLWDYRELPFSTSNFENGTNASYWFAVSMMVVTFILMLMGLRAARESNNRANG